jgi:hypothetical protein
MVRQLLFMIDIPCSHKPQQAQYTSLRSYKLPGIEGLRRIGRSLSSGRLQSKFGRWSRPFWFVAVSIFLDLLARAFRYRWNWGLWAFSEVGFLLFFFDPTGWSSLGTSLPSSPSPTAIHRPSSALASASPPSGKPAAWWDRPAIPINLFLSRPNQAAEANPRAVHAARLRATVVAAAGGRQ